VPHVWTARELTRGAADAPFPRHVSRAVTDAKHALATKGKMRICALLLYVEIAACPWSFGSRFRIGNSFYPRCPWFVVRLRSPISFFAATFQKAAGTEASDVRRISVSPSSPTASERGFSFFYLFYATSEHEPVHGEIPLSDYLFYTASLTEIVGERGTAGTTVRLRERNPCCSVESV
jgi:hypothetical protein